MKKILAVLTVIIGLTIFYNAETSKGLIYVNTSPYDSTLLIYPSLNKVTVYSSDGPVINTTCDVVNNMIEEWKNLKGSMKFKAIIIPSGKEAPKIEY